MVNVGAADLMRQHGGNFVCIASVKQQFSADVDAASGKSKCARVVGFKDLKREGRGSRRQGRNQPLAYLAHVGASRFRLQRKAGLNQVSFSVAQPLLLLGAEDAGASSGDRRQRKLTGTG